MRKKLLLLTLLVTTLTACSLLPSLGGSGNSLDPTQAAGGTTGKLVEIVPPLVQAGSNFLEVLVITALIASIFMRPVRLAVASLLVTFYGWIENFFRKEKIDDKE